SCFCDADHHVETGDVRRLVGWQRQALAVRETLHAQRDAHSAAERMAVSACAARASSRVAVSSLLSGGQSSTPASVTRWTCVWSPPIAPVPGQTSLATIQSAPLPRRLAT